MKTENISREEVKKMNRKKYEIKVDDYSTYWCNECCNHSSSDPEDDPAVGPTCDGLVCPYCGSSDIEDEAENSR